MKRKLLLALVGVLLIIAIVFIVSERSSTLKEYEKSFAISDTASITKLFLADMDGNTVLLERNENGSWTVNNKYPAQPDMMNQFLRTLMYISVRAPVAVSSRDNVIRFIAARGIKVEIYQKKYLIDFWGIKLFEREKLAKTYYVGDNTQNNRGTYMKMDNSDVPYIVYITGFSGFLHTRYSTNENEWRDHMVFNLFVKDIKSVSVIYPAEQHKSFIIENLDDRNFKLFSVEQNKYIENFDTIKIINYLSGFYNARFERIVENKSLKDSLLLTEPFQIVTVLSKSGITNQIFTFLKPNELSEEDLEARYMETSDDYPWDRERMWALVNGGEDLVTLQYFVFGRILKPIQFFFPGYKDFTRDGITVYEMM